MIINVLCNEKKKIINKIYKLFIKSKTIILYLKWRSLLLSIPHTMIQCIDFLRLSRPSGFPC